MFHLVSLSLQISLADLPGPCLGLCVGVACFVVLGGFVVGFFFWGKFDLNHMLIPVVDRPCLALVRQCRKKKTHTKVLGPGHIHRVVVCLQPAQGSERTGKAKTAHWLSEGCLSPV